MQDQLPSEIARGLTPLPWPTPADELGDFIDISFGASTGWTLVAEYEQQNGPLWVTADDPVSYRVTDERELLPYWSQRDAECAPISAAYEIGQSLYLSELSQGVSGQTDPPLRHFLFCGRNTCLEIIATTVPTTAASKPKAAPARA